MNNKNIVDLWENPIDFCPFCRHKPTSFKGWRHEERGTMEWMMNCPECGIKIHAIRRDEEWLIRKEKERSPK
jgi:transcriptional regulator NrdR family protein